MSHKYVNLTPRIRKPLLEIVKCQNVKYVKLTCTCEPISSDRYNTFHEYCLYWISPFQEMVSTGIAEAVCRTCDHFWPNWWKGKARHLQSAFLHEGKLVAALSLTKPYKPRPFGLLARIHVIPSVCIVRLCLCLNISVCLLFSMWNQQTFNRRNALIKLPEVYEWFWGSQSGLFTSKHNGVLSLHVNIWSDSSVGL